MGAFNLLEVTLKTQVLGLARRQVAGCLGMALAAALLVVDPLLPVAFDLLKKQLMQHHGSCPLLLQLQQSL